MTFEEFFTKSPLGMLWSITRGIETNATMLQHIRIDQESIMLSMQDLQTKADAAKAANDTLIVMAKSQAQLLRDALAANDPTAMQAAMQSVADTLDGITSGDQAEVTADTVAANTTAAQQTA